MKKILVVISFFTMLCLSCEKEFTYKTKETKGYYVLNAQLTTDSVCYARVSHTMQHNAVANDSFFINGLNIYEGPVLRSAMKDTVINAKRYFYAPIKFEPNKAYTIKAELKDITLEGTDYLPEKPECSNFQLTSINGSLQKLQFQLNNIIPESYYRITLSNMNQVALIPFNYTLVYPGESRVFNLFREELLIKGSAFDNNTTSVVQLHFTGAFDGVSVEITRLSQYAYDYYTLVQNQQNYTDEAYNIRISEISNIINGLGLVGGANTIKEKVLK